MSSGEDDALMFASEILEASVTPVRQIDYGSSGARVLVLRCAGDEHSYAVKFGAGLRVSLAVQIERRRALEPYLGTYLPVVLAYRQVGSLELALFTAPGTYSLLDFVRKGVDIDFATKIWSAVVNRVIRMWQASSHPYEPALNPRQQTDRLARIEQALRSRFNWLNLPIRINDVMYPCVRELLQELQRINQPDGGVVCHGDPTPSNVVVGTRSDSWVLVDWEWSGPHQDWRMLIAQMYGTWPQHTATPGGDLRVKWGRNAVEVHGSAQVPDWILAFQASVITAVGAVSRPDVADVNRFLATLYLGELRFAEQRSRADLIPAFLARAMAVAYGDSSELAHDAWRFPLSAKGTDLGHERY